MSFDKNPGSAKLAEALVGRIRKENESPQVLDFGTITSDGGLQTDTFKAVIPKGSYTVVRHLKLGSMRSIQPGDRVLVAWVQNEAVVIDIIMAG